MKQLGVVDAAFLNLEHPNAPQHVGGLSLYDPSTAPGGFAGFPWLLERLENRLRRFDLFCTRLAPVPLGISRPYRVTDHDFDAAWHLRHVALPRPSDWSALCRLVAQLHARPLDLSRPLWECTVIEGLLGIDGLPAGAFAIYTKMHHSMVDGASGQGFLTALHDLEPDPGDVADAMAPEPVTDAVPGALRLLARAVADQVTRLPAEVAAVGRTLASAVSTVSRMRSGELPPYAADAPKSRFDDPIGPHRSIDGLALDLAEFLAVKKSLGATFNDVVAAVIAGGVRRYLADKGELPDESLAAAMPVNMRTRKGETQDANQIGTIIALLHTDIADPLKRVRAIQQSVNEAKAYIDTPLVDTLKLAGVLPPWLSQRATHFYVDHELTQRLPTGNCGIITNIPGAPVQLYCAGARLADLYCFGVLTPGCGVCNAILSLNGRVTFSFVADRQCLPDIDFYKACMLASYEELRDAVLAGPRPAAASKKARGKKAAGKARSKRTARKTSARKTSSRKKPTARS